MEFKDLLEYCKAQAILNTLEQTEISVWRSICRSYSMKFSTPLHTVLEMDPEEVMLAEFESQLDEFDQEKDIEHLIDQIYSLGDPEYERQKKDELKEFMEKAEQEEKIRIKEGRPVHKSLKNEPSLKSLPEIKPKKELPKSGGIDLSYLSKEEDPFYE